MNLLKYSQTCFCKSYKEVLRMTLRKQDTSFVWDTTISISKPSAVSSGMPWALQHHTADGPVVQGVKLLLSIPACMLECPVQVPPTLLLVQLPTNVQCERQKMKAQVLNLCEPSGIPRWSSGLQASDWPSPCCCVHLGCEPADRKSLSLCLSVDENK